MSTLTKLKQACKDKINEGYAIAEKHYGKEFPRIPVTFSNKMTRKAGYLQYSTLTGQSIKITLSTPILEDNPEVFVDDTPLHELAHHITHQVYGTRVAAHGHEWASVMRVLGQKPDRTHNMQVRQTNKIAVECKCMTHYITKRRASNLAGLHCKKCRSSLALVTEGSTIRPNPPVMPRPAPAAPAKPRKVQPATKPSKGKGSKAEQVRAIIKANPEASVSHLISLVLLSDVGIPKANVKRYVTENVKRIRG